MFACDRESGVGWQPPLCSCAHRQAGLELTWTVHGLTRAEGQVGSASSLLLLRSYPWANTCVTS